MLSKMNIGTRMGVAFGALVVLALALAGSGYWGLATVTASADHILSVDVVAADTSGQVQAATLELRRFEKDYFLNLADTSRRNEYLTKWKAQYQVVMGLLDKLSGLVDLDEQRAKISVMRGALAGYDEGFDKVRDSVDRGALTDPAKANQAIEPYKDHIRALEASARVFRTENLKGTREEILRQSSRATWAMSIFIALALLISVSLSMVITRSVTLPLGEVVAVAERVAQGDLRVKLGSERRDEIGRLQIAIGDMLKPDPGHRRNPERLRRTVIRRSAGLGDLAVAIARHERAGGGGRGGVVQLGAVLERHQPERRQREAYGKDGRRQRPRRR
jgi:methyl-accepting chemotaxis protein